MNFGITRRDFLKIFAALLSGLSDWPLQAAGALPLQMAGPADGADQDDHGFLPVSLADVPVPAGIEFTVRYKENAPLTLRGIFWRSTTTMKQCAKCPAIVDFNPYRCTDGTLYADSKMYPWFAYNDYLCFRIDLQGSGNSDGFMSDEYSDEELDYCVQVIKQIARLPFCDGNVGMMGKSWSAINSLMVAARDDCPPELKAILMCCGSDDRFNDDVHYMGGAMMMDNFAWPSNMWGWLASPPDPAFVGERWKEMWRGRIRNMDFWFKRWANHQTRDAYWTQTGVRDNYDKVRVPVFIVAGWLDGYKNPVDRVLRGLTAQGREVSAMLGPWGHKYPFGGCPGPRVDWLRYIVTHWWDRWLKGKRPDPAEKWPEYVVWLGESREPVAARKPDFTESGKWVAEDRDWIKRAKQRTFLLTSDNRLTAPAAPTRHVYRIAADLTMGTSMLETSSWGEADNDDLPGDQTPDDQRSLWFDTEPLDRDIKCFGYPTVRLNLECDAPVAFLNVRLCEVSPVTGQSRLVTYTFYNLCYREGDMANPKRLSPNNLFSVEIPLSITGHIFKKGWKIRLSISLASFPAMWPAPQIAAVRLHTGADAGRAPSALLLPERAARAEDRRAQALLPDKTAYVNPELYAPTLRTLRDAATTRVTEPFSRNGRQGMRVRKGFDAGAAVYGGILDKLLVDQKGSETYEILEGDALSMTAASRMESTFERGAWIARAVTETRLWSEKTSAGDVVFKYKASVRTFVKGELFEEKSVAGVVPRKWI